MRNLSRREAYATFKSMGYSAREAREARDWGFGRVVWAQWLTEEYRDLTGRRPHFRWLKAWSLHPERAYQIMEKKWKVPPPAPEEEWEEDDTELGRRRGGSR